MSHFVANRRTAAERLKTPFPGRAVNGDGKAPWHRQAEVRVITTAIIALWLSLEVAHAWRRLKAWVD